MKAIFAVSSRTLKLARPWHWLLAGTVVSLLAGGVALASVVGMTNYWGFDEASSSTAVDSVGGANGVIGSAVTRILDRSGSVGALEFVHDDMPDSSVDFGASVGQFATTDFTISFWFRTTDTRNQELVGNRQDPSDGNFICIRINNGTVTFELDQDGNGTNYVGVVSAPGFADGAWHEVFARRAGTEVTLFVDGVKYGPSSGAGIANINNGYDFIAGFSPNVSSLYQTGYAGDLDDLALYSRALADSEIQGGSDSDGDGVSDSSDKCPGTPSGAVVDANGCSIDQLAPCHGGWRNHGAYVSTVAQVSNNFLEQGLITAAQKNTIQSQAARANCP